MKLLDVIDDILEQEDMILPKREPIIELDFDEMMFSKMANFIINLDPDNLYDEQVQEVIDMIEKFELDDIQEGDRLARKTSADKNQYSKKWYRANKTEIKRRKEKFSRSSQGRKREKVKSRLARVGKTATGRKHVKYNRRKRDKGEK